MDDVLSRPAISQRPTLTSGLDGWRRRLVELLPGVSELNTLFAASEQRSEPRFADRALATLDLTWDALGHTGAIPSTGPLLVCANHPTGAIDGLVLLSLLGRYRDDVRLVANGWLRHVGPLAGDLLPVETFTDGRRANAGAMRAAVRWLRGGGALVVFPSGAVSHVQPAVGRVADPPWHDGAARLARLTGATLVPCHLDGENSTLFQLAGLASPWLRTALLPRELVRRRGSRVVVRVGRPVPAGALAGLSDRDATTRLRALVDAEADEPRPIASSSSHGPAIADAARPEAAEVSRLGPARTLAETAEYSVVWFTSPEAPNLLDAIGRARETTFRAAGEGTGGEIDLDRFDHDYVHLVLWDRRAQELAGAYRMREVTAGLPPSALYTRTLFDFDDRFVSMLAPGLELGRAFVVPAHQRRHQPLMLLWSGIARYVAARPHIRTLSGAVSIGAGYSPMARAFLAAYLRRHALDRLRAPLVSPRHPLDQAGAPPVVDDSVPLDSSSLSARVQALDRDGKGVPVLLRQYLKLNARVIDFSVDPAFSGVLDALVSIDLPSAPRALLRRYMGDAGADAYLARHLAGVPAAADPLRRRA